MKRLPVALLFALLAVVSTAMLPSELAYPSRPPRPPVSPGTPTIPAIVLKGPTAAPTLVVRTFEGRQLFVHIPLKALQRKSLRVLVALHGMGGQGEHFASDLVSAADRHGWVLVAPTIEYKNYLDTALLLSDDLRYTQMLDETLAALPNWLKLPLESRVLVYGFSRGAQLGHRYALFFPEHVAAVAALSAGSYTLPLDSVQREGRVQILTLPFGLADLSQKLGRTPNLARLKQIPFWVGIGANDNRAGDVSRAFDQTQGQDRVERAKSFCNTLETKGVKAKLSIFPNTDHEITPEMRDAALSFLSENASSSEP